MILNGNCLMIGMMSDYVAFDNYMVYCIQQYFIYGLIEQKNAKEHKGASIYCRNINGVLRMDNR